MNTDKTQTPVVCKVVPIRRLTDEELERIKRLPPCRIVEIKELRIR